MRVVIITGAAKGIGAVISRRLAELGYSVVLADVNLSAASKEANNICSKGYNAESCYVDLTDEKSIFKCVEFVGEKYGTISGLVNNARPRVSYDKFPKSLDSWDLALAVLAKAPAVLTGACERYLQKAQGSVVNISSTNSKFVSQQPITYHAAKAALEQVSKWLAVEMGSKGIRVNSILPGLVDQEDRKEKLSDNFENNHIIENLVPLKRASKPLDIANLVAFLLSEEASYITGQSLVVDGGITTLDHFYGAKKILDASAKSVKDRK